jgi:hypothetical protein
MNDTIRRQINKGGMPLQYFLDNYKADFVENKGVYILSVEGLAGFRGFFKVGMSDRGGLSSRLADYKTMFYPVLDKVKIHALATKNKGRRLLNHGQINFSKNAEKKLHNDMTQRRWSNSGEWYKIPRGELAELISVMIEFHYGNDTLSADGGLGEVYIFEPTIYTKIDRVEVNPEPILPIRPSIPRRVKQKQ